MEGAAAHLPFVAHLQKKKFGEMVKKGINMLILLLSPNVFLGL